MMIESNISKNLLKDPVEDESVEKLNMVSDAFSFQVKNISYKIIVLYYFIYGIMLLYHITIVLYHKFQVKKALMNYLDVTDLYCA